MPDTPKLILARVEPSAAVDEAVLDAIGSRTTIIQDGVEFALDTTATLIRAYLAAQEPLTDEEIDGLCITYAYANPAGPEWWWRKNARGALEQGEAAEAHRKPDRTRMRAFAESLRACASSPR